MITGSGRRAKRCIQVAIAVVGFTIDLLCWSCGFVVCGDVCVWALRRQSVGVVVAVADLSVGVQRIKRRWRGQWRAVFGT